MTVRFERVHARDGEDERDSAKKTLAGLIGGPNTPPEALEQAAKNLDKIDARLEAAQRRLNAQGVTPQQRRDEYADEDKQLGEWRAGDELKNRVNTPLTRGGAGRNPTNSLPRGKRSTPRRSGSTTNS